MRSGSLLSSTRKKPTLRDGFPANSLEPDLVLGGPSGDRHCWDSFWHRARHQARYRQATFRADLLIAATALEQELTVVTRNLRHFTPTGVATLNPWQASGEV